jgi:hypothetical protein
MTLLLSEVNKSLGKSISPNTLMTYVTPVSKFHHFVKDDLGVSLEDLATKTPPSAWTSQEATWRLAVMMAFASKVSLSHNTVASTKRYVNQVSAHLSKYEYFVWARCHHVAAQWDAFFKGLELRKNYVQLVREGFSASDVNELNKFTWSKVQARRSTLPPPSNMGRSPSVALAANLVACRSFTWTTLFRLGEATAPAGEKKHLDLAADDLGDVEGPLRLKRDMVRFKVVDNKLLSVQIFTPSIKNRAGNPLARQMIEIRNTPGHYPETALDLYRLFLLDPVDRSLWHSTPLFRFPDQPSSHLTASFITRMDREAIVALPTVFAGRDPKMFAGHSYRIGGVEALMLMGCPDSVIQILGRWVSDCWKLYGRLGSRIIDSWRLKMMLASRTSLSTSPTSQETPASQADIIDSICAFMS